MMKLLIINGSPRKNGNVARMLQAMAEEAEKKGGKVTFLHSSDLRVRACSGCMVCRSKHSCVFPDDDAQRVLQLIRDSDALVVGSPCYWGNMPGQLKLLFDRIVYGMMGESEKGFPLPLHKGKKAVLLTTCTTPFPFNILFNQSRGTVRALKEILKWSGFKIVASLERGGTKRCPVGEKDLSRCKKIMDKLFR